MIPTRRSPSEAREQRARLVGTMVRKLLVLGFQKVHSGSPGQHKYRWVFKCVCVCGKKLDVRADKLDKGQSSCGCFIKEQRAEKRKRNQERSKLRIIWSNAKRRCSSQTDTMFYRYGGRGITFDRRWDCFETFMKDMGPRPSHKHELDRIDNNGGYNPGNCRWVTRKEQANNKSSNTLVEVGGVKMTLKQFSELKNINYRTLLTRRNLGWSLEDIVSSPVRKRRK